jgi:hypothetical protein
MKTPRAVAVLFALPLFVACSSAPEDGLSGAASGAGSEDAPVQDGTPASGSPAGATSASSATVASEPQGVPWVRGDKRFLPPVGSFVPVKAQ